MFWRLDMSEGSHLISATATVKRFSPSPEHCNVLATVTSENASELERQGARPTTGVVHSAYSDEIARSCSPVCSLESARQIAMPQDPLILYRTNTFCMLRISRMHVSIVVTRPDPLWKLLSMGWGTGAVVSDAHYEGMKRCVNWFTARQSWRA